MLVSCSQNSICQSGFYNSYAPLGNQPFYYDSANNSDITIPTCPDIPFSMDSSAPYNPTGGQPFLYASGNENCCLTARNILIVPDGIINTFSIGSPIPTPTNNKNYYVESVLFNVSTIFSGNNVAVAKVTDGTNILMTFEENDITELGVYVADLAMTFNSNGKQCLLQFYESDGTTLAAPSAGYGAIIIDFIEI